MAEDEKKEEKPADFKQFFDAYIAATDGKVDGLPSAVAGTFTRLQLAATHGDIRHRYFDEKGDFRAKKDPRAYHGEMEKYCGGVAQHVVAHIGYEKARADGSLAKVPLEDQLDHVFTAGSAIFKKYFGPDQGQ